MTSAFNKALFCLQDEDDTGFQDPDELADSRSQAVQADADAGGFMKWYCSYLERKYARSVGQYCAALQTTLDAIEAPAISVSTHLARAMDRDRHVSLQSLSKSLAQTFSIQSGQDGIALHAQLVFCLVGHLSFLYSPRLDKFGSGKLELHLDLPTTAAPQRLGRRQARTDGTWRSNQVSVTDEFGNSLGDILSRFGGGIPRFSKTFPSSGSSSWDAGGSRPATDVDRLVKVMNLNYHTPTRLAQITVIWTDTICDHLEFNPKEKTSLSNDGDAFVSGDAFAEILCSYRLIFGQNRHAHRAFRRDFSASLLGWSGFCRDWADAAVYEHLNITNVKNVYSAAKDFPYLGGRLAVLNEFMEAWEPDSWQTLWDDRRNLNRYYTLRFVDGTTSSTSAFSSDARIDSSTLDTQIIGFALWRAPISTPSGGSRPSPSNAPQRLLVLDERHDEPHGFSQRSNDTNSYTWGRMGKHNIVIASLAVGVYGTTSAATTASSLLSSLPQIKIGLLVGIGGGIARPDEGIDIRLGDVVVSQPDGATGGVVQYDLVKAKMDGTYERKDFLSMPPPVLLHALSNLQAEHESEEPMIPSILSKMLRDKPRMAKQDPGYAHQGSKNDQLFKASYKHAGGPDCHGCDPDMEIRRDVRDSTDPGIHYGIIASGNMLVMDAATRDKVADHVGGKCLCVEMEAAGLMNHFPCLVIRGICDYADSHKNDRWQRYASATAAAFGKELLGYVPVKNLQEMPRAAELLQSRVNSLKSDSHLNKLKKWLSPPDPSTNLNAAKEKRHKDTGDWFINSDAFIKWKSGSGRNLWLHGLPGCGKTVLSSAILDHLQDTQTDSYVCLGFFFDFRDQDKQHLDNLLRSLAFQLYSRCVDSQQELNSLLASHEDGRKQPTTESLSKAVHLMMQRPHRLQIILDALDECTARSELLNWMETLSGSKLRNVRFIATSRREEELESGLGRWMDKENMIPLDKSIMDFFQNNTAYTTWSHLFNAEHDWDEHPEPNTICPLYFASLKGLNTVIQTLLEKGANVNTQGGEYGNALQAASFEGHDQIVQILLEKGADMNAQGGFYGNALLAASYRGHDKIVQILLEKGADMNAQGGQYGNALQAASSEGHDQIVQILLEKGADINAQVGFYGNALQVASYKGYDKIVQILLEKGADVNVQGGYYGNALQAASFEGHDQIVQILLEKGADMNAQGGFYGNALLAASYRGHDKIVQILLEKGADINAQGGQYGNALLAASSKGHDQIVQILLEKGADMNAGHDKIVQILLEKGADMNAQGGFYGNALQAASSKYHDQIVQILLEKGADVNA
ncbi:hypothetical protein B0T24DRAFT_674933 [Lasiosphaeria ovina]|uniref:NACHT domain-containing protein n=1 Tax=Lasiosphaeria ovina TaxID=92902 RepID=A0AAE0KNH9_9PEZI|nr:hypothetical protein B0T24DRAFT_674933 [Lasiosphaeria ovina]